MPFDVAKVLADRHGENYQLHSELMNPQWARVLRTTGFDRFYVRGEGCYLYDDQGERYLDMLSGFGVYALGRSHPALKAALHQALDLDLPNMVQFDCALLSGLLAEALIGRAHDGIRRAFFCNSGAEAVETAIKFARYATKRPRIVYAGHAFHGLTTGALALNGGAEFKKRFGPLVPSTEVPFGDIDALRRQLRRGDVAAFVVEPIQGKGVNVAPDEYWHEVQATCRRYKTLFVTDEVQTGLGRTGRFFCHQHWDLKPDIITVSKALSGGYIPVGATLCTEKVFMSVFSSMDRAMVHSSTFGRNQLAMVAGLATLDVMDEEGIVERARVTGESFGAKLAPLVERYEMLHEVRGLGLMIGLEFGPPESARLRRNWNTIERIRPALFSQTIVVPLFHRHRILTQVAADNANVIKLLPPLIAGEAEVDAFVSALDDVLATAHKGPGHFLEFGRTMAKGALFGARRRGHRHPGPAIEPTVNGSGPMAGNGHVAQPATDVSASRA
jgi:acetylornithine/succinyldiaminopimelate/putrescine aminotransferase